ncbi:MarR family transcriptional regulator [Streptomyces violaceoruber]|uniref:MarR family transcriptional regulator n=2 Tax=Streptomyces TaxID=1883 RepID=A0A1V0U4I4_STRVN|nr:MULTISPECIES: MarR family transcriptional regulator [Streptomyces]ARF60144.1 MarR family transcriptional regulator [Streptomyces violaceoruber]KOG82442.1 MarR family transcriptional regulator [Streptomyces griseus subsp. rhodochrous]NEA09516.1 MarR family transcriptional regulator [Streptomyces sp. SID10692]
MGERRDESRVDGGDEAEAVSRFVERFAAQLVQAGMARMPARVFAALLSSERGALTSAELGEQLRVSPAAVSGAVRYLSQVDMVSREREPGSRRERYRVQGDQWYDVLLKRDSILRNWQETMREGVEHFGPDSPQGRRINDSLEFFRFLEKELGSLMQRWAAHRAEHLEDQGLSDHSRRRP